MKRIAAALLIAATVTASGCVSSNNVDASSDNSAQILSAEIVDKSDLELSEENRVDCETYFEDNQGESISDGAKCYKQNDGSILVR